MGALVAVIAVAVVSLVIGFPATRLFLAALVRAFRHAELARLRANRPVRLPCEPRLRDLFLVSLCLSINPLILTIRVPLWGAWALLLVGVLGTISVWVLHSVPGHERALKYQLLAASSAAMSCGFTQLAPIWTSSSTTRTPVSQIGIVWQLAIVLAGLIFALVVFRPWHPMQARSPSTVAALRWHRRLTALQGPDLLSAIAWIAMSVTGFAGAYIILRFCVGEKVRTRPFLYFRSFSHDRTTRTFETVIMPALYRSGAVSGVVHRTQTSVDLHTNIPPLWRAHFQTVPDSDWKTWAEGALACCTGVVIDLSEQSESLLWELGAATRIVGAERIFVLTKSGARPALPPGVVSVEATEERLDGAAVLVAQWGASVGRTVWGWAAPGRTTRARRASLSLMSFLPAIAIGGLITSVVLQRFVVSLQKTKNVEARLKLRKIADMAGLVWAEKRAFPPSVQMTPPMGACCSAPFHKCMPTPDDWKNPTWESLSFSMDDPHYYSYAFESDGDSFKARAVGDLDCDGISGTFEVVGHGKPDGTVDIAIVTTRDEAE